MYFWFLFYIMSSFLITILTLSFMEQCFNIQFPSLFKPYVFSVLYEHYVKITCNKKGNHPI